MDAYPIAVPFSIVWHPDDDTHGWTSEPVVVAEEFDADNGWESTGEYFTLHVFPYERPDGSAEHWDFHVDYFPNAVDPPHENMAYGSARERADAFASAVMALGQIVLDRDPVPEEHRAVVSFG